MRKYSWRRRGIGLALAAVVALLLFTPLGNWPLSALFPVGPVATVDFARLRPQESPNRYLVCPTDYCGATPDAFSPVFDMPPERLRRHWHAMLAARPRVEPLAQSADGLQFDYVQRTARFRFPDIITVRFLPVPPGQSTLAIYSHSVYGRSDLGVNRARVEAWLAALRQEAAGGEGG